MAGGFLPYMGFLFRVNRGKNKANHGVLFGKNTFFWKTKRPAFSPFLPLHSKRLFPFEKASPRHETGWRGSDLCDVEAGIPL
jgi:hypothetical protein